SSQSAEKPAAASLDSWATDDQQPDCTVGLAAPHCGLRSRAKLHVNTPPQRAHRLIAASSNERGSNARPLCVCGSKNPTIGALGCVHEPPFGWGVRRGH